MDVVHPQGRLLGGRFELRGELGRGGMGVVHRALDRTLGREVALKVVQQGFADPESRARFEREGQLTAALRHPNIVAVHSAGEVEGRPFIAYELVAGARPLDRVLAKLDLPARVAMVRDVARALGHAHAHGIVHRDVKPANVLVDDTGRPRVSDFGLATAAGLGRLTQTGEVLGTPNYMSPEQLKGDAAVGPPTDVWALGGILYRALTDEPPFAGSSFFQLAGRVLQGDPPRPPRSINPAVPRAIEAVCLAALRRDPAERPRDGEDLARRLDEALRGGGDAPGRSRAALAALGTVALLAVGAAVWLASRPREVVDRGAVAVVASAVRPTPPPEEPPPHRVVVSPSPDGDASYTPHRPHTLTAEVLVELESHDFKRVLAKAQQIVDTSGDPHERAYAMLMSGEFYAESYADLGKMLWHGAPMFPRNPAAARRWLERAVAEDALGSAPRLLAELHLDGPVGIRDLDLAIQWGERAIKESDSEKAEWVLGAAYSEPGYARRDPAKAAKYLERAAQEGDLRSRLLLEELCVRREIPEDHPSLRYAPLVFAAPDDYPPDLRSLLAKSQAGAIAPVAAELADRAPPLAAPLLARAFELGDANSGMLLGKKLLDPQLSNPDAALEMMVRAVAAGVVGDQPLDRLRKLGLDRVTDVLRARYWARFAAAKVTNTAVLLLLGDLLVREPVVDLAGARRAYARAAGLGSEEARHKLDALSR